jgi:signal peptidase I
MQDTKCQEPIIEISRSPVAAGLFSLIIPGLGQVYNGQLKKGIVFYALPIIVSLLLLKAGVQYKFFGMVIYAVLIFSIYIFIVFDAVRTASKTGAFSLKPYNRWYVYLLVLFLNFGINTSLEATFKKDLFGLKAYKIPSSTMVPTLLIGDHLMVDIGYYKTSKPARNDIIVFKYTQDDKMVDFIKRVIAIEGDTIESKDKVIYLNGQRLEEPFVIHEDGDSIPMSEPKDNFGPLTVPEGKLFVFGDNRDRSYDSRFLGFIDTEAVKGKALYIYWSKDKGRIGKEVK